MLSTRKSVTVLLIVMIEVATTMPLIMASTSATSLAAKCPLDAVKLGDGVDVLGELINIGTGNPVVNQCCPLLENILGLEAALCLCTTIRVKLLNLNILLPLALELVVACGKNPPPGFQCPAQ